MSYLSVNWQSPVNWNHGLSRSLLGLWMVVPHWSGGTILRDLTGRFDGTLTSMDPATDWISSPRWGALNFDATNDYVDLGGPTLPSNVSIFAVLNPSIDSAQKIVFWGDNGTTDWTYFLGLEDTPTKQWACGVQTVSFKTIKGSTPTTGETVLLGMTWNAVDLTLWLNGQSDATAKKAGTPDAADKLLLGRNGNGSQDFGGDFEMLAIYSRALGAGEVKALDREWRTGYPNLLRRISRPRVFVPPAAPAGVTPHTIGGGLGGPEFLIGA